VSRIATDILGLMGQRTLEQSRRAMNTALERLSTGKRINRASDDPAGMVAATNLSVQAKRAQGEISSLELTDKRLDATDGGLGAVGDLLCSLQSVVVEAANTGAKDNGEREALQVQAASIIQALDHVSVATVYDGDQILQGYHASALGVTGTDKLLAAAEAEKQEMVSRSDDPSLLETLRRQAEERPGQSRLSDLKTVSIADLADGKALNLIDGDLGAAQKVIKAAVDGVARSRAELGAQSNSNRSRINALFAEFENTMAAKSAIEDTDFAHETSELVRNQILGETSIRAILIGRQQAAGVVKLL
jgi:flagellin